MTDFFTRFCTRVSWALLLLLFVFDATAGGIAVKSAELERADSGYQLNADFDIAFGPEIEAALGKGVPLTFLLEFQIVTPREYWFDKEVTTVSRRLQLRYHALTRQYLLRAGQQQQAFGTLAEAKEALSSVRQWKVADAGLFEPGLEYHAVLRYRLDPSRLPKALQVEALGSEKWNLVSERYRWIPPVLQN